MAGADRVQAGREPNSRLGDSCLWRVRQCGSVAEQSAKCAGGVRQCGTGSGRRWSWVFGFPWEKWEGQFCAARTFLGFLTRGVVPVRWRGVAGRGSERWEERVEVR